MTRAWISFRMYHNRLLLLFISLLFHSQKRIKWQDICTSKTKILLANQKTTLLNQQLLTNGQTNTICLVTKHEKNSPENVFLFKQMKQLEQNNADVLIISGKAIQAIGSFHYYRHAAKVVLEISHLFALFSILFGYWKNAKLNRVIFSGSLISTIGSKETIHLVFSNQKQKQIATRKFISPLVSIESFFASLNTESIRYVILRWFEGLPNMEANEDIDLLVANEDAFRLNEIMNEKIGTIPCDTYTVTGIPGFDFKQISYFTPSFAKRIVKTAVTWRKTYRVPNPTMHFDSMAYHALYHKGQKSGLPSHFFPNKYQDPEHDYQKILQALAAKYDIHSEINLEALHERLTKKGYQPPLDTLYRLSLENKWAKKIVEIEMENPINEKQITIFILREEAIRLGLDNKIIKEIENEGFTIVAQRNLTDHEKIFFSENTRGGNWSQGPYPKSGGKAAKIIITTDLTPLEMNFTTKIKYPGLQNKRVTCKNRIRDKMNQSLNKEDNCNMLHSSDNDVEAWYYLKLLFTQEQILQIVGQIDKHIETFQTKDPVLKNLTGNGRRAKVELIQWNGERAVKKTFKPQSLRFLEREISALNQLSDQFEEIPELLLTGGNYLIYPYYQDRLKWKRGMLRFISLKDAKKIIGFLEKLYQEGYAFVDFHPMNVLYDKRYGFKIIDYEFLYQYQEKPSEFRYSYDIVGLPPAFDGDAPLQNFYGYRHTLMPYIGVDLESLMNDSSPKLHYKRLIFFLQKKLKFSLQHKAVNYLRKIRWTGNQDSRIYKKVVTVANSNTLRNRLN